jgi:hypothetical protein
LAMAAWSLAGSASGKASSGGREGVFIPCTLGSCRKYVKARCCLPVPVIGGNGLVSSRSYYGRIVPPSWPAKHAHRLADGWLGQKTEPRRRDTAT